MLWGSANWISKVLAKILSFSLLKIHHIWNILNIILFYCSDTKYITLSKTLQIFSLHIFKPMNSHTQSLTFKWRCTHPYNLIYVSFVCQSYGRILKSGFILPLLLLFCVGLTDVHSYRINMSTTLTETKVTLSCNSERLPKNITS